VGAQTLLVAEVFGLFEFADHSGQLFDRLRARRRVGGRREIAGRLLVALQQRLRRQVEHQVVAAFAALFPRHHEGTEPAFDADPAAALHRIQPRRFGAVGDRPIGQQ
jgi:hypothetical protein